MNRIGAVLLVVATGCGTTVIKYAPETPDRVRTPARVDLSDVSRPWRRDPIKVLDNDILAPTSKAGVDAWFAKGEPAPAEVEKPKDPRDVISEANRDAYTEPEEGGAEGHTHVYVYDPDREYSVYACAKEDVMIRLASGERLLSTPILWNPETKSSNGQTGNNGPWGHIVAKSGDGHGQEIEVLLVRPKRAGIPKTRMRLLTNVGPYTLELNVVPADEQCMRSVRFRHPQHELNLLALEAEQTEQTQAKVAAKAGDGCTSANYHIEVMEGSPAWVPTMVWRECEGDHAMVHIQFPPDIGRSQIPTLLIRQGQLVHPRFNKQTKVMTVDTLFAHAKLQMGDKERGYEIVGIHALKE
jgi:type IV secretion system protein VirB9